MARIIINSDDFGMDKNIDEACIQANKNRKINSISVIVNYKNYELSKKKLKSFKGSIGIHLNLTQNSPVLKKKENSLTNKHNKFLGLKKFIFYYLINRIKKKDIYDELNAQILKLKKNKIKVLHLDSHQHIHMLPKIWEICNLLAAKHRIKRVRITKEEFFLHDNFILKIKKIIFNILSIYNSKFNKIKYFKFYGLSLQESPIYNKLFLHKIVNSTTDTEFMVHLSKSNKIIKNEKIKHGRKREFNEILKMNYNVKFKI
jgi:predicted glycoside hydrolase/deacetylase ChbG (UPF0249 family)